MYSSNFLFSKIFACIYDGIRTRNVLQKLIDRFFHAGSTKVSRNSATRATSWYPSDRTIHGTTGCLSDSRSTNKSSFLPPRGDILHTRLYLPHSKRRVKKWNAREARPTWSADERLHGRRALVAERRVYVSAREKRGTHVGVGTIHSTALRASPSDSFNKLVTSRDARARQEKQWLAALRNS